MVPCKEVEADAYGMSDEEAPHWDSIIDQLRRMLNGRPCIESLRECVATDPHPIYEGYYEVSGLFDVRVRVNVDQNEDDLGLPVSDTITVDGDSDNPLKSTVDLLLEPIIVDEGGRRYVHVEVTIF